MNKTMPTSGPQGRSGQEGETKERKALTFETITKRVAAMDKMDEAEKRKARRMLIRRVLNGIAEGTIGDPAKAAQAVVHLYGKKADDDSGDA